MVCVLAAGVHGPGSAVQWEIPVRLHAGRSHAGTAEMDPVFLSRSSSGSGHKIFIRVDRGSNPLRDANSSAGGQVIGCQLFSKEAQCSQERSAETGLKDWGAPELVTGNFQEDWPRGSRHSLAKREPMKVGSWFRIPYLPPSLSTIRLMGRSPSWFKASGFDPDIRWFESITVCHFFRLHSSVVEQRAHNPPVVGSAPTATTSITRLFARIAQLDSERDPPKVEAGSSSLPACTRNNPGNFFSR